MAPLCNSAIASSLPTELKQQILAYLGPIDFNSARHICRSWMAASLDLRLLSKQAKRGGWSISATETDFLSRYIARECALSGSWAGRSFREESPMQHIRSLDVTILNENILGEDFVPRRCAGVCATSMCGKYFVMSVGSEICTYEMDGISINLIATTTCERNVEAAALTVRLGSFVLAVLLEGRIGMYIESTIPPQCPSDDSPRKISSDDAIANTLKDVSVGDFDEISMNAESIGSSTILHQSVEIVTQRSWAQYYHGSRARLSGMRHMPRVSNGLWPDTINLNTLEEQRSNHQIVYRNVCSAEDPPCSVAISPSRKCVAFGSKAGVELYWIDPTTGRNLNRWFPLTQPSDHLYFLPPRRCKDDPSRLRLIGTPNYTPCPKSELQSPQSSFWFTLSASWRTRSHPNGTNHSRAIPLSDGYHILFTDDETGLLSLGSDKPASSIQRLSRKFVFEPPATISKSRIGPTVYAVANELSNGVRIAAGYDDDIILFSVPADALRYSTAEQEQTLQELTVPFEELEDMSVLSHPTSNAEAGIENMNMRWVHYLPGERKSLEQLWPLKITGIRIGSMTALKFLAVHSEEAIGGAVNSVFSIDTVEDANYRQGLTI